MKIINVVAAIIKKDDKIFSTQRGYGEFKGGWEFPGGKMELGETPQQALCREIKEELETEISVDQFVTTVNYDYPNFHLTAYSGVSGRPFRKHLDSIPVLSGQ